LERFDQSKVLHVVYTSLTATLWWRRRRWWWWWWCCRFV